MDVQTLRAEAFKALHARDGAFVIPNPWDAGSAKLLASLGFEALATTSAGYAFSRARPDGGLTLEQTLENVRAIVAATDLPVAVDLENGFADDPVECAQSILQAAAAGAVGGALLLFAAMQVGKHPAGLAAESGASSSAPAPLQPAMAAAALADGPTAPATLREVEPPPLVEVPAFSDLLRSETLAWHALGRTWNQPIEQGEPCATALKNGLQCYRTGRMTLHGLRQLGRPGILTLRLPGQPPAWALLVAMGADSAVLQAGERRWQLPLTGLADIWRGDYTTLWRTPPGQQGRLNNGNTGPAADWLAQQLEQLQSTGQIAAESTDFSSRVRAFQRSQGVDGDGLAGPMTFMLVNRASGVDEPRLGLD